ncbi:MAG: chromosome segregation protein [Anaerolineaceae bacterium]|nr:MAG: chromosome segregation protein [Anaerolineaceae bacterium]
MPLRLKSLQLHGYKTFAARTDFEFAEGITAIVGPNGSGKSNIADALRWVLGEQSHSLLRAKKTEDMIFAGSEQRTRAGMASATVVFDNSDNWLPVDFSEVAVTRRAYRDGHNEYLLNGQHVRLKDIYELLAQSGLSERTYTILGQGLVDASLALKADERRRLFEEAAGIGLYRARREEALRRLDTTKRNLERALDILAELEPRLKSLERQARRAQEYAQVQADLRLLLRDWYGYHWHRTQRELGEARDLARGHDARLQEAREAYQSIRANVASFRERLQGLRARLNSWHRQSSQLHDQRETISRDLAVRDERARALLDNRQAALGEQSRLEAEVGLAAERLNDADVEMVRLKTEFDEAQERQTEAQSALEERQEEKARLEADLASARRVLDELTARRASMQARLDELAARRDSQQQKIESAAQAIAAAQAEAKQAEAEYQKLLASRQQAEKEMQAAEAELQSARKRLAELEDSLKEGRAKRAAKQAEQARLQAQLDVLEQAEQSLAGYADGAKLLLDAARQQKLGGARGALSSALDVPAELEAAIAAALGEYTDAVLIQSGQGAEQALALLDADEAGRASLLPLDWLSPAEPLRAPKHPDCLGLAADLVKAPADLSPAVDLLLGQVIVVRDRKTARALLAGMPAHARAVTLRGEVFHASGQVLAGKPARAASLARPRQRRELQEMLANAGREGAALDAELRKLEQEIAAARAAVESREGEERGKRSGLESARADAQQAEVRFEAARRGRDWQISQRESLQKEMSQAEAERTEAAAALSQSEHSTGQAQEAIRTHGAALAALTLDEFQSQVTYWGTRLAVAERAAGDARARQAERSQAAGQVKEQAAGLEKRLAEIDAALALLEGEKETMRRQEGELNARLEELRVLIEPAEKELETAEAQEADLQKQEAEGQGALALVERQHTQVQLETGRRQEALDLLRQKIEDDFGLVAFEYQTDVSGPVPLPFDGMVEQLNKVTELPPDLEENLTRQRALLRRMGPVNPEAQQEFVSVKERHEFMTEQMADLRKAEADLHQVIAELDTLTRTEFFKTFSAVAEEFHVIFTRLFGGGSARLALTDPDNLTETGIDIEARLPGRREQGLALLSGGERSLTAIALVFALLKVSPTPVCVMDEVDAMLDEANVGRFRGLLLDLSRATQFVIITHNRNTVQAADVIYGVTMGRDSTSQVISLKLDEVSDEYLK